MWKYRLPCRFEQAVGLDQARFEEGQVIVKDIGVAFGADLDGLIALPAEAGAVAVLAAFGADLRARLGLAGVEGRIDVDQVDGCGGQGLQDGEVVTEVDACWAWMNFNRIDGNCRKLITRTKTWFGD